MSKKNDSLGVLIESCRDELDKLIPDSIKALENSGYECHVNKAKTEIIIKSKDEDLIKDILRDAVSIPRSAFKFIMKIKKCNGFVFIRQRVK